MNFEFDSGKLLYALGVLFAIGAFLYFVRDVVFGLSITVKAVVLFFAFVAFFVAGVAIERAVLDVVAFALSGISYAVFLGYVIVRYSPGETGAFLLFGASAVLFLGLGYAVRERDPSITLRRAGLLVAGLAFVTLVLVGADVAGGGVSYTADLEEEVILETPSDVPDEEEIVPGRAEVGTMTAQNDFVFRRSLDLPSARGCVAGMDDVRDERVDVRYSRRSFDRPGSLAGGETVTYDLEATVPVAANESAPTMAVEVAEDCDRDREEPTLLLVFEDPVEVRS